MKRLTMILMAAALVLGAASIASANCVPGKAFSTWDFNDGLYYYVFGYNDDGSGVGNIWEPGNRPNANEGTYDISNWLRYYAGYGWYITGDWGDARMSGCPSAGSPNVLSMTQGDGSFAIGQADETPAKGNFYNYGNLTFTPIPVPAITNSSNRTGTAVTVDVQIGALDDGYSSRFGTPITDSVSAINLYSFTGAAAPGNDAGAWTLEQKIPYAGGVTNGVAITVACDQAVGDTWLAAGIELTGELDTVHVSGPSTMIECDPTLADPGDKFDLIRDKGKGKKKGRPFNR